MPAYDAACDASFVEGTIFCVSLTSDTNGPIDALPFDEVIANDINPFSLSSKRVTYREGTYFMHLSAGLQPNLPLDYHVLDLPTDIRLRSTNTNHSIDIQSRDIVVELGADEIMSMAVANGTAVDGNDVTKPTTWAGFSLDQFMSPLIAFSAVSTKNTSAAIGENMKFDKVLVDTNNSYNATTGGFTVPETGIYFLSFTSGVESTDMEFQVVYTSKDTGYRTKIFKSGQADSTPSFDTVSKSLFVRREAGDILNMQLLGGTSCAIGENSVSFSGFKYAPNNATEQLWAAFKKLSSSDADPLDFDQIRLNDHGLYDEDTDEVNITVSGYYVLTMTGGTVQNYPLYMALMSEFNNDTSVVMAIDRAPTGDVTTLSRTIITYLYEGQILWVSVEGRLFSGDDLLLTSFSGFLLSEREERSVF